MSYEKYDKVKLIRTKDHSFFKKGRAYIGTVIKTDGLGRIEVDGYTYTIMPDGDGISVLDFFEIVEEPQSEDDIFRASLL